TLIMPDISINAPMRQHLCLKHIQLSKKLKMVNYLFANTSHFQFIQSDAWRMDFLFDINC
ncbi:hypothetical protein MZO44_16235, partial [Lactiplantibacillus sp. E932]|nr:hypothetical protein [Lactiplantibacillus sp. E932]MDO7548863.1 hypothetical protein [Lactiplantibacillus plantarum]